MKLLVKFLVLLVLAILVGGAAFLATWEMPPPSVQVEKPISNDRFR